MEESHAQPPLGYSPEADALTAEPSAPVAAASNGDGRAELLGRIKDLHDQAKSEHTLDLDVPGYQGLLVARFKPFPVARTEATAQRLETARSRGQGVLLHASCDTLIDACQEVLLRAAPGDEPFPIDPEALPPYRFDQRLAELLGFMSPEIKTARQIVIALFPTEQSILAMNVRVSQWMQDVTKEVAEDLLGE